MVKYGKPPIVEAWLAFDFEPKPDKTAWDMHRAQEFAHLQKDKFPHIEGVFRQEFDVEEPQEGELPRIVRQRHILDVVRMRDEASKRVLQLADDRMAYNVLEAGNDYPGFATLLTESLEYVGKYSDVFQPAGIRQATIHYTDIIAIPIGGATIQIEDYFSIARDLPEEHFGLTVGFSTVFATRCPLDGETLRISLAMVSPGAQNTLRFRMDWEKNCGKVDFSSEQTIRSGLTESHDFMVNCFENSMTPKTRNLFEPL